jgi:hypothetical protein
MYMRMRGYRIAVFLLILLVNLLGGKPAFAQGEDPGRDELRYFPETRHWVQGEFLVMYESVPHPELVFGNPISVPFRESTRGRLVQYFERARFEYMPDNPPELRIQLTELGRLMYTSRQPPLKAEKNTDCRNFPEMKTQICYAFLDFFDANGGVAQFGYPISNFEIHDGLIVQYFQRARFEWHRELPEGQRVQLSNLGEKYFFVIKEDPKYLFPPPSLPGDPRPQLILGLKARAFSEKPFTAGSGIQTIHIIAQDQYHLPLAGAQVKLVVQYPDGSMDEVDLPDLTDKNGFASHKLAYENQPPGITKIQIIVSYVDLQSKTVTSFRIW